MEYKRTELFNKESINDCTERKKKLITYTARPTSGQSNKNPADGLSQNILP